MASDTPEDFTQVLRDEYEASQLWLKRVKELQERKREGDKRVTSTVEGLNFRAEAEYVRQELIRKIAKRCGVVV